MNVAYVSTVDTSNRHAISGIGYSIPRKLAEEGASVVAIDSLQGYYRWDQIVLCKLYRKLLNQSFFIDKTKSYLKGLAKETKNRLRLHSVDAVLSSINEPLAYLDIPQPKFIWTDHFFENHLNRYTEYQGLCKQTISQAHAMQKKVIQDCSALFCGSQWAADSAIHYYGASQEKVHIIPFGPNLDGDFTKEDALSRLQGNYWNSCQLLMISSDWERKRCSLGVEIFKCLKKRSIPVRLKIVGAQPPSPILFDPEVELLPFMNRSTPEGMKSSIQLYRESFFHLFPSKEEAFGTVVCEASATGTPTLGSRVGGIMTTLKEGKNGHLIDRDASAECYADLIEMYWNDRNQYIALCESTFDEYQTRLNWKTAAGTVLSIMKEFKNHRN